ncbi:endocuticle structural glycoprotein ABD-4-like isoform X1 [Hyposmocoma kahamanoa]|uniref:endocuticle structural glycoprotein ABD-4-like isoform X1 n=1 Tax=Hyposmocoma kahamanoa TaxID=1477025 RepID=UPI000E6D670B|nr:endocuticle structural glycoprotein ABD-4-like isoform X1 [Hyposmocoma kahamanoa]
MNFLVLVCMLIAAAFAAPQGQAPTETVPIVRQDSQVNGDGSYQYSFETGNGISADQKGDLKKVGDVEAIEVSGQFQYPGENGNIQLTYVADENGYQPQGAHLPTAPPVPEPIQKALAYLATAPPQPEQNSQ